MTTRHGAAPPPLVPIRHRPPDRDPARAYLASLAPASRRAQSDALELIAHVVSNGQCTSATLPWEHLRSQHTVSVQAWLRRKYGAATVERHLGALRSVLREAWCLRLMSADAYYRAASLPLRGAGGVQRAMSQGEFRALLSTCAADAGAAGPRDGAILHLVFRIGLRQTEVVALDFGDFDPALATVVLRPSSGGGERRALLGPAPRDALCAWLPLRQMGHPALFQAIDDGGRVTGDRLPARAVPEIVQRRIEQAAIRLRRPGRPRPPIAPTAGALEAAS